MALNDLIQNEKQQYPGLFDQNAPNTSVSQMPQQVPNLGSGGLKPLVSSPRLDQENALQSKINAYENPQKPQGFWQNLRHVAAGIGNIAGDAVAPNLMADIPHTWAHEALEHASNIHALAGLQSGDLAQGKEQSEENLQSAEAEKEKAQTQAIQNPTDKPDKFTYQQTDHGLMRIDSTTGEATPVTYQGQPLKPAEKPTADKEDTPQMQVYKDLVAKGMTPEQALERTKERPPVINVGADTRAEKKEEQQLKGQALKIYQPSVDSAERFNVMTDNAEKALRDHDQQAMLSLLANHLGMTMGLQKGARLNQAIINEAAKSQPWLQHIGAKFDSDGYLAGLTLGPQQIHQMVNLGQSRFAEDTTKARNEGRYIGVSDDGPDRSPGKATINYYTHLANGDVNKAKELAKQDGWTISK